jgi:multisubunit Na+/H+ antiporter MnhC subunit
VRHTGVSAGEKGNEAVRSRGESPPLRTRLRRWLLVAAVAVTILGIFHHVDHVVRGNHSGWPFQEAVTPFTFSLLIYALLLPGLYLTWRGRLMARYWLFTAAALFAVVTLAHFVGAEREAPIRDIYSVYDSPLWGLLALADLTAIFISLAVLAIAAVQALRLVRRSR